ncbi:MAG: hypothetical protein ICV54_15820 [Nostoc sp. C3-bin3]|nr:hypothetical protein [Nostoc sp. C3-bin3]
MVDIAEKKDFSKIFLVSAFFCDFFTDSQSILAMPAASVAIALHLLT